MDISIDNLSLILGVIAPGLFAVWGLGYLAPDVRRWFAPSVERPGSVGGVLLVLAAAITCGLVADAVRVHVVDPIHYATGVSQPDFSYGQLDPTSFEIFKGIIANHFLFHEFYGNTLVCALFAYLARQFSLRKWPWRPSWRELLMLVLVATTWAGSRTHLQATTDAIAELVQRDEGGNHAVARQEGPCQEGKHEEACQEGKQEAAEEVGNQHPPAPAPRNQ